MYISKGKKGQKGKRKKGKRKEKKEEHKMKIISHVCVLNIIVMSSNNVSNFHSEKKYK